MVRHKSKRSAETEAEANTPLKRPIIRLSDIIRHPSEQRLWEILPSKDDPYNPRRLSEREVIALEEALDDGFGKELGARTEAFSLPKDVDPGLLRHQYHLKFPAKSTLGSDNDDDIGDWKFWSGSGDFAPAPWQRFPLGYNSIKLRIYFRSQFERFCRHFMSQELQRSEADPVNEQDEIIISEFGLERLYEKPWYEIHALQLLDWLDFPRPVVLSDTTLAQRALPRFAGTLGRLVEQYYWRFQHEDAAVTGRGARSGASAGGKALASIRQNERRAWQVVANEVWARRPDLNIHAVAEVVKKRLRLNQTAKHIGRYIRKPPGK